jgi:uncharacterized protein YfdQ (DUF2303 family)
MFDKTAIEELSKAQAIRAANDAALGAEDVLALPDNFSLHDLEPFQYGRRRHRGAMVTSVLDDFARYVEDYAQEGAAAFVDQDKMRATAVLNLGPASGPGHADHLAQLQLQQTAAYAALLATAHGGALTQQVVAEFLEDWAPHFVCKKDGADVPTASAVGALRNITVEGLRKVQATETSLSASRSALESVTASSSLPLPTELHFTCEPYVGLQARTFVLRLGVLTTDKPAVTLRVQKKEQHAQEMAAELASLVRHKLDQTLLVVVGSYTAGK